MAEKNPISPGLIERITGAWSMLKGDYGNAGNPIQPSQPGLLQAYDFPFGINMQTGNMGEVNYTQLRQLADGLDILRLVIETRKDQVSQRAFNIVPKSALQRVDDRCLMLEDFFQMPDGENNWNSWLRQILEEMLVTDTVSIHPWLKNGGTPYRFELIDGTTIKRLVDGRGRTPEGDLPAYQQIIKGLPTVTFKGNELIYAPRNKRVHKMYGFSPVEQIVLTINTAIRRAIHQLSYYTEGSTADLIFQVPPEWSMQQLKDFNNWWQDSLAGNSANRRKVQFVPNGVVPYNTKEKAIGDQYDEWIARVVCYAFSVSSQPFVKQLNRSTSETAYRMAMEEGLQPVMLWVKGLMDRIIRDYWKFNDLEFRWVNLEELDYNTQSLIDDRNLRNGTVTIDEVRIRRGMEPFRADWSSTPMTLLRTGWTSNEPVVTAPIVENGDSEQEPA